MVDEKLVDFGSFALAALLYAIVSMQAQITALYANDPYMQVLIGIAFITLSQIGSRYAVKLAKDAAAAEAIETQASQVVEQAQEEVKPKADTEADVAPVEENKDNKEGA
jgi:hypothetical protein